MLNGGKLPSQNQIISANTLDKQVSPLHWSVLQLWNVVNVIDNNVVLCLDHS